MWIVCAHDHPLVVTVENAGFILGEAEFEEKGAKPDDLSRAMRARNVFCFAGQQSNNCLLFGRPRNRAVATHDNISGYGFMSFRHSPIRIAKGVKNRRKIRRVTVDDALHVCAL